MAACLLGGSKVQVCLPPQSKLRRGHREPASSAPSRWPGARKLPRWCSSLSGRGGSAPPRDRARACLMIAPSSLPPELAGRAFWNMFTLIKEEVNSTFLLFDKFIDHRCCERVLSVFLNQVQGKRSKGGSNPKLIFAPLSLSVLLGNPWCGAQSHLLLHQGSACFRLSWMFLALMDVFFRRCLLYILPTSWPHLQFVRVELPVFIPGRHFLLPPASSPLFSV